MTTKQQCNFAQREVAQFNSGAVRAHTMPTVLTEMRGKASYQGPKVS